MGDDGGSASTRYRAKPKRGNKVVAGSPSDVEPNQPMRDIVKDES